MKRKTFIIIVLTFVFPLLGIGFANAGEVRGVTKNAITVGIVLDITGPFANDMVPMLEGYKTYLSYVNDRGGIHGRKVKAIVEDSRYAIPLSISAFKKLVFRDGVLAILGLTGTGHVLALERQIQKEKVPVISISLSDTMAIPLKRYVFMPSASYQDEVKVIIDYIMKDLKAKEPRIAFISFDIEFGKVCFEAAQKQANLYGLKIHKEIISPGALEATSQVLNLKKYKPDFTILHTGIASTVAIFRDAKKLKLPGAFIATYWAVNEEILNMAGKAAREYIGVHSFNAWYEDTPGMAELRKMTLKYHPGTEKPYRPRGYTQAWISSMLLTKGLEKAGENPNSETLVDGLERIRDLDTQGLCGHISFSSTNHKASEYCRMYKGDVDKGIFRPITDWISPAKER